MVELFNQGGGFMWPILVFLIIGLAIGIAKMWTLWRAGINTRRFIERVRTALKEGGTEAALEICENTRGPVASIFHAGLMRAKEGIDYVEKSITNAGSIEMAFLEKGMIWLGFINFSRGCGGWYFSSTFDNTFWANCGYDHPTFLQLGNRSYRQINYRYGRSFSASG
jgi:hypothetical protein